MFGWAPAAYSLMKKRLVFARLGRTFAYVLSNVGQEEGDVVGVAALHQADVGDVAAERALENGLQQSGRGDFNADGVLRDVLNGLVEEDRRQQVVDVVSGRALLGDRSVPRRLWDAGAVPARSAVLRVRDDSVQRLAELGTGLRNVFAVEGDSG